MSQIQTSTETDFSSVPAHRVYLREDWGEPWVIEPYLYCEQAAKRASPETSTAMLAYEYGFLVRPDRAEPALYAPLAIEGFYVKVEIDQVGPGGAAEPPIHWYGIAHERGDNVAGAPLDSGDARQPTGRQTFACFGLENLLAREVLRTSTIETPNGGNSEGDVGRPIPFNAATHKDEVYQANRSPANGDKGACIFASDLTKAQPWTTADIIQYLLAYRSPKDVEGNVQVPFSLDLESSIGTVPSWDRPRLQIKTETLKELFDKLLDRKRLISYFVDVVEGDGSSPDEATIYAFGFSQTSVSIPVSYQNSDGSQAQLTATLWANTNTASLDFDESFDVEIAQLKRTIADQYDQVIVRGARKGSVFTVSFKDGTLEPDWDTGPLQTEYNKGASRQGDYPNGYKSLSQWRNRLWRSNDKYKRVYRYFRVPSDWDGYAKDGENGPSNPAFPRDSNVFGLAQFWRAGLVFKPHLPLLTDHDYSGDNIKNGNVPDDTPAASRPEPLRAMAWLKVLTSDGTTRYQHVEKLSETAHADKYALGGAAFHCGLRMQDRALGVELNVNGPYQHAIAKTDFAPADSSDITPALDYRDNLICTVFAEHDSFAEGIYPATVEESGNVLRTLLIDLSTVEHGRAARLDYVAPGTVVGLLDGVLQRSSGGYVRDDRGRLNAMAQVACQWYQTERQAFTFRYRQIDGQFKLGTLITQIGSGATLQNVNTPITSVEWDLVRGTTTIATGFADLDLMHF